MQAEQRPSGDSIFLKFSRFDIFQVLIFKIQNLSSNVAFWETRRFPPAAFSILWFSTNRHMETNLAVYVRGSSNQPNVCNSVTSSVTSTVRFSDEIVN